MNLHIQVLNSCHYCQIAAGDPPVKAALFSLQRAGTPEEFERATQFLARFTGDEKALVIIQKIDDMAGSRKNWNRGAAMAAGFEVEATAVANSIVSNNPVDIFVFSLTNFIFGSRRSKQCG